MKRKSHPIESASRVAGAGAVCGDSPTAHGTGARSGPRRPPAVGVSSSDRLPPVSFPAGKRLLACAAGLAALGCVATTAQADVLYAALQATSLYANNQIGFAPCCGAGPAGLSGPFGVGDTITFAAAANIVETVDLYGYAGGGSKPIEVDIYAGANPNAGALLGSATVTPAGDGWTTETFDFHGLVVPRTVTVAMSIVGNGGSWDDSFVDWQQFTGVSGSPTVGAAGDMWYGSPGAWVVDDAYAVATGAETNTLALEITGAAAAPEPATWGMLGLGFAALVVAGRRRDRSPRSLV